MEKRLFKYFITLFAFITINGIITSHAEEVPCINSSDSSHGPKVNGTPKASKSIQKDHSTLVIYLDDKSYTLCFNNLDEMVYNIYDENGNMILQETAFDADYTLNLASFPAGHYTLTVIYGGVTYNFTFDLNK